MKLRLLLLTILYSALSWGQASLPLDTDALDKASLPTGFSGTGLGTNYTTPCSTALRIDAAGDNVVLFFSGIPGTLSYQLKANVGSGSWQGVFLIEESPDGASWTTLRNISTTGEISTASTGTTFVDNPTSTTRYIRWIYDTKTNGNVAMCNVDLTAGSTSPTITINPSTLSGMVYTVGSGPSAEQFSDISGSNLTTDITLTAPTNYEMSITSGAGFGASLTLTQSGGNVATTTIYVRLKAGLTLGTYNGEIISCSSTGATTQNITCNGAVVNPSTPFEAGDFAVIALNSNINCYPAGPNGDLNPDPTKFYNDGDDEISFITFRDIQNGDTFYMTDNGFERANANEWGNTEGVYQFTRTGGTITAGTVITFRLLNTSPFVEFISPDASWSFTKVSGFGGNLVMNSGGDQVFFMQGGTWNNPGGTHDATYTPGTYLYAFNTNSSWTSFGGSTQQSGLPINLRCFSLMPGSATDYLEYTGPTTATDKLSWIARLNNPTNWTNRVNCAGFTGMHVGQSYSVTPGGTYVDGVWVGSKSTDWFDCGNWQTLKVPDETIDVVIGSTYGVRDVDIDISSPNASIYNNVALAHNLTMTEWDTTIGANPLNSLEVHGDLLLDSFAFFHMMDGNLHLYGNWTSIHEIMFTEGNGTVHFDGSTDQIISNVAPEGTEIFNDVVMNNNFTTSISNNLIANGDLIVNSGKTVTVNANDYIQVGFDLTNNGTFNIEDDGSLVQVDDSGVNTGNINYERITTGNSLDYVYWSSPVNGATTPASGLVFSWSPDMVNPNNGLGYWVYALNTAMQPGVGYIMRNVFTRTFNGVARNGVVTPTITRGGFEGTDYAGTNGITITRFDDNWNLIGNPYPSAIDAVDFLTLNSNIEGAVRIWTHGTLPSTAISDPFYDDYVANYTPNDYITYNSTGTVSGPAGFNGYIAGGQSFLVNMLDGAAASSTVLFNNSLRDKIQDNSQFYKIANTTRIQSSELERHRIWLDIIDSNNKSDRTLIGYVEDATYAKDRMFDAVTGVGSPVMKIYSIIDNDKMTVQGRSLPFDVKDKVQLGVYVPTTGMYNIGISATDGLFVGNQEIYLEDKVLNIIYDLKQAPYSFYANAGQINERFVLRYTNQILEQESFDNNNDLMVYSNEDINISFNKENLKSVIVYNVLGQVLYNKENINNNNLTISEVSKSNQTLVVKVVTEDNMEYTRKVIF